MLVALAPLVVVAAAWGSAPPTAEEHAPAVARAVVVPLAIEGRLETEWRTEFEKRLRAGLERGDATLVDSREQRSCSDAACWRALAKGADAGFVVSAAVKIVERDYDIGIAVHAASDGRVVVRVDQRCELCGLDEAATQLGDAAAAIAGKIDALATVRAAIAVESAPNGAAIAIDDVPIGKAPLVREIDPGAHSVSAKLSGFRAQTRAIEAVAGVQQLVRFELVDDQPGRVHLRRFGWVALGLGAAAVIAGAPLVAIDERPVTTRCSGENVNAFGVCKYRHDTLAGGAVLIATGAAALVAGTVIAVITRKHARRGRARAQLGTGLGLRF